MFAFLMHSEMCSFHFKSELIVTPRIFTLFDTDSSLQRQSHVLGFRLVLKKTLLWLSSITRPEVGDVHYMMEKLLLT